MRCALTSMAMVTIYSVLTAVHMQTMLTWSTFSTGYMVGMQFKINVVKEYFSAIEKHDTEILMRDKQLAEKKLQAYLFVS